MAYVLRFANQCKSEAQGVALSNSECDAAQIVIIRLCQNQSFGALIDLLKNGLLLKKKNTLCDLNPFLDKNGLLRVGGHLKKSSSFERKHPIILSAKSHFVQIYVRYLHEKYFHAG